MGVLDASTSPPKERYAVSKDNIIKLIQPGNVDDQLTEILRNGARALLAQDDREGVSDIDAQLFQIEVHLLAGLSEQHFRSRISF